MTRYRLSEFEIELGAEWLIESAAAQLVAHDREDAELVVSAARLDGEGPEVGLAIAKAKLVANACAAAELAMANPELTVTQPLTCMVSDGVARWRGVALTKDHQVFFGQAICEGRASVVILTFEGPNAETAGLRFEKVCDSVKAVR
ncbi:MAG: hypothetical protein Q8L48_17020 [Archangium sp.]|nr:hypothetical protein [Archangium sp.]